MIKKDKWCDSCSKYISIGGCNGCLNHSKYEGPLKPTVEFKPPKFCKDCKYCRPNHKYCNILISQGQLNCPEFEEKGKCIETCEDCVHFDVRGNKIFCRRFDGPMVSINKGNCKFFKNKSKSVMPTTDPLKNFVNKQYGSGMNNPYFEQRFVMDTDEMGKLADYCKADVAALTQWFGNNRKEYHKMFNKMLVKKVIFNPPATIVLWKDGTKTVVKAQGFEVFDKEKGFAMACAKKFFGNQGNYYDVFKKHGADCLVPEKIKKFNVVDVVPKSILQEAAESFREGLEVGFDKGREIDCEKLKDYDRTKSDYIIEKIKEFTRDFWMLKVYSELDTEEWVLDIGVMNNDKGKSMRYIVNLEDVEWERIDESIGRVTSSIANELIPSAWKKESE